MTFDLILVVAAFVAIVLFLRWREPHMLYYPDRSIDVTPDHLGLKYDDVSFITEDLVKINGWFVHAPGASRSPRSTILFFHGNAGNISHRMEKLQILAALGVDTFIIDYRGYGRSEGQPDEQGTYRDAQVAYEYLTKTLNREPGTIIVYGESLGSAVAVDLAAKQAVGGVIIEEAFTSVGDVGQKMFPFLPVRWLVRNKYDTLSKIGRIKTPLLIFHSRDDEFFDIRHAQRLLAAANEPKQLVELTGGHNDAFAVSGETYRAALKDFLIQCSH
jgi:fermentation-respiration switch protein FrsA (DUF1100 family)